MTFKKKSELVFANFFLKSSNKRHMESVDSFTLRLLIQQIDENVEYGFPINDWLMRIYNLVKSRDA